MLPIKAFVAGRTFGGERCSQSTIPMCSVPGWRSAGENLCSQHCLDHCDASAIFCRVWLALLQCQWRRVDRTSSAFQSLLRQSLNDNEKARKSLKSKRRRRITTVEQDHNLMVRHKWSSSLPINVLICATLGQRAQGQIESPGGDFSYKEYMEGIRWSARTVANIARSRCKITVCVWDTVSPGLGSKNA